jgi:hypothetical protein
VRAGKGQRDEHGAESRSVRHAPILTRGWENAALEVDSLQSQFS